MAGCSLVVDLEDEQVVGSQHVQSLSGGPKAQHGLVAIQARHLLLGYLPDLPTLFPVEEDRVHGRRLSVQEDSPQALAQRGK